MTATFLSPDELRTLTGRARKALQVEQLRRMGLPFWVNAAGRPVVARAAVEGANIAGDNKNGDSWQPNVLKQAA